MNTPSVPEIYNLQELQEREEIQRRFMLRVFAWMTFGLFCTAAAALFTASTPALVTAIYSTPFALVGLLIAEFAVVIVLSAAINRLSPVLAGSLFMLYSILTGVTFSIFFMIFTASSIAVTFGITACTFGIMALYGYTTQRDLSSLGSFLIMGLIGMVLASLANLFLRSPFLYWMVTYAGILIFVGLIAYDTQKLRKMSLALDEHGQVTQKASILGALNLYLDFINLFLLLLRILGRQK
jgi:uncharacterized protein